MCLTGRLPIVATGIFLLFNQDPNAHGRNFGFERQVGGGAQATATVNGTDMSDTETQLGDVLATASAQDSVSVSNEFHEYNATGQAVSEALVLSATGATAYAPTVDTDSSLSVTAFADGYPVVVNTFSTPTAQATYNVTSSGTNGGFFEGGLQLVGSGSNSNGSGATFELNTAITVGNAAFAIAAAWNNATDEWTITTTTPTGTIVVNAGGLNEFLFVSWPVNPGDQVAMNSNINSVLGVNSQIVDSQQGLWIFSASAFGYAAEQLGDFDGDGDADGRDFLTWQRELGVATVVGDGADGNGDGMVDNLDLEIWQRQYGESINEELSGFVAVPEPTCSLLIFGMVLSWLAGSRKI